MLNELQFSSATSSPSTTRVVAMRNGTKVGVAHTMNAAAERWPGNEGWAKDVSSLWVHPEHAGTGVGEAMLQHIGHPLRVSVTENNNDPLPPAPRRRKAGHHGGY